MKMTLNEQMFIDQVKKIGRWEDLGGYDGWTNLFNYLEEMEESCDMEIEFDVIAFCCDYSYYDFDEIEEFKSDYGYNNEEIEEEDLDGFERVIRVCEEGFIVDCNW